MPLRLDTAQFDELVADPGAPIDGEFWFNTTTNELKCRANGATAALVDATKFANAIQSDVAAQFTAIALKAVPVAADVLLIEDSAAGDVKKRITVGSLPGGAGGDTVTVNGSATASTNVDLDDALPAPPVGEVNVKWQKDALAPTNVSASVQASSEVQKGVLEIATQAETNTGTDDARVVTPLKLASTTVNGIDGTAIHSDVAAEIVGVTEKVTPIGADVLLIEDSAAANVKRRVQIANLPGGAGGDTITVNGSATASTNVDLDDALPAPPADATNVLWQKDALSPTNVSAYIPGATEAQRGALELATQAETNAGTDDTRAVTPLKLASTTVNGLDGTAIHNDTAGEIAGVTAKTPLIGADLFLIEDSAAANAKKSATVAAIRITESQVTDLTHTDTNAVHVNVAGEILGVAEKVTPVAADVLLLEDSAAANVKKRVQIGNLPGGGGFLEQKAGRVLTVSFSGNPLTAVVVFSSAFATTNYGIQLTALTDGTRSFTPNATTKATTGFTIDLGTAQSAGLTEVAWLAMADGESI